MITLLLLLLILFILWCLFVKEEEATDLSKIMMSKKTKRLYGRMQHSIGQKQDAVEVLETKRKISETAAAAKAAEPAAASSAGSSKAKASNKKAKK